MNGVKSKRSGLGSGCCCALRAGESARTNSIMLKTSTSIFFLVIPPRLRLHTLPRFRYFNKASRSSVSRRGKAVGKPQVGPWQVSECAKDDARTQIATFGRVAQLRSRTTAPIGAYYKEAPVIFYPGLERTAHPS